MLRVCVCMTLVPRVALGLAAGNEVADMHEYRRYHGLDRALAGLLQHLIVKEPADPGAAPSLPPSLLALCHVDRGRGETSCARIEMCAT